MGVRYVETSVRDFLKRYPWLDYFFPSFVISDPRYVVRYDPVSGDVEWGYPGDEWYIK